MERLPPRRPLEDEEEDRLRQYERLADLFEDVDASSDGETDEEVVEEEAAAEEE